MDTSLENRAPTAEFSRLPLGWGYAIKAIIACRAVDGPDLSDGACAARSATVKQNQPSGSWYLRPRSTTSISRVWNRIARLEEPLATLAALQAALARAPVVIDGVQRRPAAAVQAGRA